jgi:DNA-binding NtrC family response regulator
MVREAMRHRTYRRASVPDGRPFDKRTRGIKDRSERRPLEIHGHILVVDDTRKYLEENSALVRGFGYSAITATTGEEALRIYRERGDSISLVILDYNLPGLNGHQVLKKLRKINPKAKVVICSKGLNPEKIMGVMNAGAVTFLPKPVMPSDLGYYLGIAVPHPEAVVVQQ